ncbi:MAG: HypC/HybG/HupF family hydrogenase formation chaperone [Deltaproteobacteria bacterium]|nr:HypC/HybG/HupF family hydrogenase formation chaperone [Deltaproteobacteria bacterium]
MCLGIPGRIITIKGSHATVDVAGTKKDASIKLLPGSKAGDYVIIHAGFAIEKVDEEKARETLNLIDEIIEK